MNLKKIKEECITWLPLHGLATSGTLQDQKTQINKFQLCPLLEKKSKVKNGKNILIPVQIQTKYYPYQLVGPVITAFYQKSHHLFSVIMLPKREGCYWATIETILNADKQQDCLRKILFQHGGISFVKTQIRKSFCDPIRPTTILLEDSIPPKA